MLTFDLSQLADQTFTTQVDDDRYTVRIFSIPGTMACDVSRNEIQIVTGQRITNACGLIPFLATEGLHGNFILLTKNNELPNYNKFGITQTLVYMSLEEIKDIVG